MGLANSTLLRINSTLNNEHASWLPIPQKRSPKQASVESSKKYIYALHGVLISFFDQADYLSSDQK